MDVPRIKGLAADLVPHRQWALRRWFYANPIWYYHRPSVDHEICARGNFYQLVDEDLRELCRLLNDAGLHTTPSCQGHFYPRERFEKIWDELEKEQPLIRGGGLLVKDSENQRQYLFQDESYRIPWADSESFYQEAAAHQNLGYLGIIVPEDLKDSALPAQLLEYSSQFASVRMESDLDRLLGGIVISVMVNASDSQTRAREWQHLTGYVRRALESSQKQAREADTCQNATLVCYNADQRIYDSIKLI